MKRTFLLVPLTTVAFFSFAQTGTKPAAKPVAKPAPALLKNIADSANYAMGLSFANFWKQQGNGKLNTAIVMKAIDDVYGSNKDDSACYALGITFAKFYKEQGVEKVNKTLISKGLNDVMITKKPLFNDGVANSVMNSYLTRMQEHKAQAAIDSGNAFLQRNKLRPEVKVTASGLQYEVITEGAGEKPGRTDTVTCHYRGTLLNGTPFDDSYSRGQPINFALNKVIPGWTEGLQLMGVGSKYKFYIPYTLGYGPFDYGPIPGGSMLTFEVELLNVKRVVPAANSQPPQPPGNN